MCSNLQNMTTAGLRTTGYKKYLKKELIHLENIIKFYKGVSAMGSEMQAYIGSKIILAEPMTDQEFNKTYRPGLATVEQPLAEGYHVQYPDGYDSWSPKCVFENAYRPVLDEEKKVLKSLEHGLDDAAAGRVNKLDESMLAPTEETKEEGGQRFLIAYPHKYTEVTVEDKRHAVSNGNHHYRIFKKENGNIINSVPILDVHFQNGPIKETGINGVMDENLIAIVIDRLQGFQTGPYASRENALALTHLETAMLWLNRRTALREARGVEGTHKV